MSTHLRVGFLGAGKMATALAKGLVQARAVQTEQIRGSDPQPEARQSFTRETGAGTTVSNLELAQFGQVLILAVKPAQVGAVLEEIKSHFTPEHLLMSIAAGVRLKTLAARLPPGARIIRMMPNTPALVGASATGYALGESATAADAHLAQQFFSAVGFAVQVRESLLDAITGLSGSGPAYVFLMIEALSDGGVATGLPREVATRLAAQTLLGAAKMVLETGLHPGALKDMVTSPGGTTIEGLHELEKAGVRAAISSAVRAAADKARQLGKG